MKLPDLTPATLECLVNGGVCSESMHLSNSPTCINPDCSKCHGSGRTAPDLRTVDALVCRELSLPNEFPGGQIQKWKDKDEWVIAYYTSEDGSTCECAQIPRYTTDWAHGGRPLLDETNQDFSVTRFTESTGGNPIGYRVMMLPKRMKPFIFTHPSELVARVCAWLIWKVKTKP